MNLTFRLNKSNKLLPETEQEQLQFDYSLMTKVMSRRNDIVTTVKVDDSNVENTSGKNNISLQRINLLASPKQSQADLIININNRTSLPSIKKFKDIHREIFERTSTNYKSDTLKIEKNKLTDIISTTNSQDGLMKSSITEVEFGNRFKGLEANQLLSTKPSQNYTEYYGLNQSYRTSKPS